MKENADANEELYVVARILEASAKSDDCASSTERAVVHARTAELAKKGLSIEDIPETVSEDVSVEAETAVEKLRLAVKEIEQEGGTAITDKVDDAVVARLRSEYD